MSHLKRCGPIRRSRAIKRTALIEVVSDEAAANDGDLTAADLAEIDAFYARADSTEPTAAQKAARDDERAMSLQLRAQDVNDVVGRRS